VSTYPVTSISLAPRPGEHSGTGTFQSSNWLVVPSSVPPPGNLAFFGKWVDIRTMLFAIADDVVPNWFGVAVPPRITDFTHAHVFFHPTPAQAGYVDADYKTKSGLWPRLFYYMERLGYQLDGAERAQVLIMPFMTEAAKNGGIFPGNWQEIVPDILTGVRDEVTGTSGGPPVALQSLVVSSYSAGIIYSDSFRRHAAGLGGVLAEVWDLDGHISTYQSISDKLRNTAGCRVIQYDQIQSNDLVSFHVPRPRWADYVQPPQTGGQVHSLIRDFMFMHGASISDVGETLDTGPGTIDTGPGTIEPGTATHSVSATHSATPWETAPATVTAPAPVIVPVAPTPIPEPEPVPVPVPATPVLAAPPQPPPCCGDAATVAVTGTVAVVAQTAVTAITALAAMPARRHRQQRPASGGG
jgi:hypothetical protein